MKESGIAGQEIVDALLTNSATFVEKTEFAQEKYKSVPLITHTYSSLYKEKILF